jgi:UDP-2-acetamido-3-amino-2,3-dideoxy-glucuronate N-acetyltransferase
MSLNIHFSAIVDSGATIGEGTYVWHFVHICSGAHIGKNCSIGQNVFISNKVIIGNNVKIQNNVSIYDNVEIQDDVFCGPSMVFTNVVNPRSFIKRKNEYLDTLIKKGATLGANCTIICGVTIGEYAFIAAGAVVTKNVSDFALYAGVPAKQIGWMSKFGKRIELPLIGNAKYICPYTGDIYELRGIKMILKN